MTNHNVEIGPPGSATNSIRVPVANFVREAMGLLPICDDCGHEHTPDGCTGEPTASDLWAGVSPSACDCPVGVPPDKPAGGES